MSLPLWNIILGGNYENARSIESMVGVRRDAISKWRVCKSNLTPQRVYRKPSTRKLVGGFLLSRKTERRKGESRTNYGKGIRLFMIANRAKLWLVW